MCRLNSHNFLYPEQGSVCGVRSMDRRWKTCYIYSNDFCNFWWFTDDSAFLLLTTYKGKFMI